MDTCFFEIIYGRSGAPSLPFDLVQNSIVFFLISGATEAAFAEAVGDRRRSWVYIV